MTAKELKEIVNNIPDGRKIIFTYSGFTFENIDNVESDKSEMPNLLDCHMEDFYTEYKGENYCLICFTN